MIPAGRRPRPTVAAFLTICLLVAGVIGMFMPNTTGKSLDQLEVERATG
ncbi:hypothetical protein ABCR94_31055 [Streptomyces sp. 21So2-11]